MWPIVLHSYHPSTSVQVKSIKWPQDGVNCFRPQQVNVFFYSVATIYIFNIYFFTWWSPGRRHVRGRKLVSFPSIQSHSLQTAPAHIKLIIIIIITMAETFLSSNREMMYNIHYKRKGRDSCWTCSKKTVSVSYRSDLVLYGHDRVVLGRVDVQDVEVILPAQVVGDVGERGAGRLGHAVVDYDHVVLAVSWLRWGQGVPLPQTVLRVPLLDLSYLVSGDGSFWGGGDHRRLDTGEVRAHSKGLESWLKCGIESRNVLRGVTDYTNSRSAALKLNLTSDLPGE